MRVLSDAAAVRHSQIKRVNISDYWFRAFHRQGVKLLCMMLETSSINSNQTTIRTSFNNQRGNSAREDRTPKDAEYS